MFEIDMKITPPLEQIIAWVEGLEREVLKNLTEFWDKWAIPAIIEELARIFATEGYGTWPPLSPRYERQKRRMYPGKRILRREDAFYRAVTKKGGAGNLTKITPTSLQYGVDLGYFGTKFGFPYPAVHEKGSDKTPARPVFVLAEQSRVLKENLVAALKNYLAKSIRRETRRYFGPTGGKAGGSTPRLTVSSRRM